LLAAAIAVGIGLSAIGIVTSGKAPGLGSPGAVATVNGEPISAEAFARFVGAVASERKQQSLDRALRRRMLARMIDEELLLQRGFELGLARHEPTARRAIVAALIASVATEAEADEPDEDDLLAFYAAEEARFARPGRLELEVALVSTGSRSDEDALVRAEEISRQVRAGAEFHVVERELGDRPIAPLPKGRLPFETLRQYLGPTVARTAAGLEVGAPSDPIRGVAGYYVVRLASRIPGDVAPFEDVRSEVRGEYLRNRGEVFLGEYIESLRDAAEIEIHDPELAGS
jgi:parvulin-like peptidyl-prolyl isomerase